MTGDSLGVIMVLALGGLVIPITMLLMAALVEILALAWAAFRVWHDDLTPTLVRFVHRVGAQPLVRLHPRG